ncbi:MAG: biotin--[acetyl-CoA-carboxylase] ligase [Thomasclavelia sp.]|nr:biotin--[acetyl-CoA-carboxylase] ligase [Thomasclavelia sp.]
MKIIHLQTVDSTNDYLKRNINSFDNLTFVDAMFQTKGRGRNGHTWITANNTSLLLSVLVKEELNPIQLSIGMAYSIIQTLNYYHIKALIKWPNDIFVNDKKISGILVETIYNSSFQGTIIGIGLNVYNDNYISIEEATNIKYSIKEVENKLIEYFTLNYKLIKDNKYHDILDKINDLSYLKDKEIDYKNYGIVKFIKLNYDGTITLENNNQERFNVVINEISLSNNKKP